jgi:2'-5' RNA ligase
VAWVGAGPEEKFTAVANAVRDGVKAAGVTLDRGDFRAHLTLFRIRDRWPPACIEIFNGALRDFKSDPIPIDSVTLFSSKLNPKGAIHTPLRTFALA